MNAVGMIVQSNDSTRTCSVEIREITLQQEEEEEEVEGTLFATDQTTVPPRQATHAHTKSRSMVSVSFLELLHGYLPPGT
jgi:hypothetical protein